MPWIRYKVTLTEQERQMLGGGLPKIRGAARQVRGRMTVI